MWKNQQYKVILGLPEELKSCTEENNSLSCNIRTSQRPQFIWYYFTFNFTSKPLINRIWTHGENFALKKKKIPTVCSGEMQRINCHVNFHFLPSYTELISRFQLYFVGKQCASYPYSFEINKGWAHMLTSEDLRSVLLISGTWGKSFKWKTSWTELRTLLIVVDSAKWKRGPVITASLLLQS